MAVTEEHPPAEMREGKRPQTVVAGPYGHPFHPLLVTVPIGAWIGSLVLDVGSQAVDGGAALARGAWWMIAVGVLGAVIAAVTGLIDLLGLPTRSHVFRLGIAHMLINLAVTGAFAASYFWRLDSGLDVETSGWQIALSAVALAVLGVSGWIGGQLSYRYGVRVADESDQVEGYARGDPRGPTEPRIRH